MDYFSIWPFFACLVALLLLVATPPFAVLDAPTPSAGQPDGRITTLDGLRGYLALAVVFHHGAIYHGYTKTGAWQLPPSHFYTMVGPMGVAMFFMVTGHLFWGRLLRAGGELDWRSLYIGRLFRLGPVYFLAVAFLFAVVLSRTGPTLNVSVPELIREIGVWLMIGVIKGPRINGYDGTAQVLAGVTWTLRFEWLFYFSLPLLAWLLRRGRPDARRILARTALAVVILAAISFLIPANRDVYVTVLFALGILSASLANARLLPKIPDAIASVIVLGLLAAALFGFDSAYQAAPMLLMGGAFCLIAHGCTLFGALTTRPAQRLGHISYGLYLLQGLALLALFWPAPLRQLALTSPAGHWSVLAAAILLLVVGAAIAHVSLERPGIRLGRLVARRYRTVPAPGTPRSA